MGYEAEVIRGFNEYCQEKRRLVSEIADGEQRALQEKVLVARSLLHHESEQMLSVRCRPASRSGACRAFQRHVERCRTASTLTSLTLRMS